MSSSFPYIDVRILERHNQLEDTIGALDMEVEALERIRLLSWLLFPVWIFLSVVQAICFALGNGDFHPLHSMIDSHENLFPTTILMISGPPPPHTCLVLNTYVSKETIF